MQTIFLEFKHSNGALAANGTDVTFHIDGRWSWSTTKLKIEERLIELRAKHPQAAKYANQLYVGYTHSQEPFHNGWGGAIKFMRDPNPPEWALGKCAVCFPKECVHHGAYSRNLYTV